MQYKAIKLLNLQLELFQEDELYSLMKRASLKKEKTSIFYCDFRLLNYNHKYLLNINHKNIFCYPDSTGVYIILKLLLTQFISSFKKLVSTDINIKLLHIANENNLALYILGSSYNVLQLFIKRMIRDYPNIKIAGYRNGFDNIEEKDIEEINNSNPDILLVGMGVPKQELWVIENYDKLNPMLIVTVGAFFSFYSGHIRRAPKILRALSLEWFVRLIKEPGRLWRRYFIEYPLFVMNVFNWKNTK